MSMASVSQARMRSRFSVSRLADWLAEDGAMHPGHGTAAAAHQPRASGFTSRSEALAYYRDEIRPRLNRASSIDPGISFADYCDQYLAAHSLNIEASTLDELRGRLRRATTTFGQVTLRDMENRAPEIAAWRAKLA